MPPVFRVSRLPIIHAIRTLASEGFVQINPHWNAIVTNPTLKDVRTRRLMVISLEAIAIREAWPLTSTLLARMGALHAEWLQKMESGEPDGEADWRFHDVVWLAPEVTPLHKAIQTLCVSGSYYRSLYPATPDIARQRMAEHRAILDALHLTSPEVAIEKIKLHRLNSLQRISQVLTQLTDRSIASED